MQPHRHRRVHRVVAGGWYRHAGTGMSTGWWLVGGDRCSHAGIGMSMGWWLVGGDRYRHEHGLGG